MVRRETYLKRIRPFIDQDVVKVLTGIRRAGKSVMLELIRDELLARGVEEDRLISFNFESMASAAFCTAEALYAELSRRIAPVDGRCYLFFDEIQEVARWERCINSARVDFNCDIYITGSNAKLLSGELATCLGGRYVKFVIYPFSFSEYLLAQRQESIPEAFRSYLGLGGMPFLTHLNADREAAMQYLRDIYSSVVLKDIVKRNAIRDVDLLERIVTYVLANIGHTFSARSISNYFKNEGRHVSPDTVLNYLRACCDAYLFRRISREDLVGKKLLSVNEKYYLTDHGLRQAVYGSNARDPEQLLENIVCMELLRRGYDVTVGKTGEREIDFTARRNGEKLYVQVAYLLAAPETIEREFGAYMGIRDNYPKYVVSMDAFDMSRDGIKHRSIPDFLLAEEWN